MTVPRRSVSDAAHVEQRVGLEDAEGEGNGAVAAQAGFLDRAQIGGELIDGRGLFHAQRIQPVLADEVAHVGPGNATGGNVPLLRRAVAVVVALAVGQQLLAQEGLEVFAVSIQQVVQLPSSSMHC